MLSRIQCALLGLCVCLTGCAPGDHVGDWLWWPGFNPISTAYIDQVPVHDVALEVQCEIYDFLEDGDKQTKNRLLDPKKGAGVVLILQTDLSGSVQYVGVNLSKLGFPNLAELVTATNKVPSLQAKGTGKTTISAEVDFTILQTDTKPSPGQETLPNMVLKKDDVDKQYDYVNATFNPDPKKKGAFLPTTVASDPKKNWFPPVSEIKSKCKAPYSWENLRRKYLYLWLDNWLTQYKGYLDKKTKDEPWVCNTKVTLKSAFQIVVDVSAGVNAFMVPPIILPISGFNVDGSPDWQHSIAITFALQDAGPEGHSNYCSGLQGAQPSTK